MFLFLLVCFAACALLVLLDHSLLYAAVLTLGAALTCVSSHGRIWRRELTWLVSLSG